MTRGFDLFFDLPLNKRLHKQSRRRGFETPSRPLWRRCNVSERLTWQLHPAWIICVIIWGLTIRRRDIDTVHAIQNRGESFLSFVWRWLCSISLRYIHSINQNSPITIIGLTLDLSLANERRRWYVTTSLIGWTQIWNQPCIRHTMNNLWTIVSYKSIPWPLHTLLTTGEEYFVFGTYIGLFARLIYFYIFCRNLCTCIWWQNWTSDHYNPWRAQQNIRYINQGRWSVDLSKWWSTKKLRCDIRLYMLSWCTNC